MDKREFIGETLEVKGTDAFLLMSAALRYAVTRHTYIVRAVLDLLVANIGAFTNNQIEMFRRDLIEVIDDDVKAGYNNPNDSIHHMDYVSKVEALEALNEAANRR